MNLKWVVGSTATATIEFVLSRQAFPLTRLFPHGRSWLYDVQRFAGRKDLRILFDVGANVGQTTTTLVKYFPNASIFSFEPVGATFASLRRLCERFQHVRCLNMALGSSVGVAEIEIHRNSELNTLVCDGPRLDDLVGVREAVSINTVDAFCATENVAEIDIFKMDVQGWEMEVLRGARDIMAQKKVRFVFSEVGFRRADRDMQHFAELNDFMETSGFWLCGFYDSFRWGENKEFVGFANALYMNRHIG